MGRKVIASRPRPPILLPLLLVAVFTVDAANNIGRGAPSRPLWFRSAAASANVTTLAYDYVSNVEVGKVDGRTPPAVRYTARVGGHLLPPTPAVTKPTRPGACGRGRTSSPMLFRPQPPLLPHEPLPSPPHPTAAMHRSHVHRGHAMHSRNASTQCIYAMHPRTVDILPLDASDPATTLARIRTRARYVPLTWRCAPTSPLAAPIPSPFAGACCPCGQWRRPAACGPLGHHTQRRTRPHRRLRHQQDKHRQGVRAMESDPPSRALPMITTILCGSFSLPLWHWTKFLAHTPFSRLMTVSSAVSS